MNRRSVNDEQFDHEVFEEGRTRLLDPAEQLGREIVPQPSPADSYLLVRRQLGDLCVRGRFLLRLLRLVAAARKR